MYRNYIREYINSKNPLHLRAAFLYSKFVLCRISLVFDTNSNFQIPISFNLMVETFDISNLNYLVNIIYSLQFQGFQTFGCIGIIKSEFVIKTKVIMQEKLFQRCTHLLHCSVLSLGGNVNTRQMSKPDMGSIFHIKNQLIILVIGYSYVKYQNFQNSMLSFSSDTKRTLMHL